MGWEETPRIGEKKGTKRSLAVESYGLPVGIVLDGANRHDVKLLEDTLKSIVTAHPEGMNPCLDAGYTGSQKAAEGMGYEAYIRFREEESRKRIRSPK
jgi:putative transposase